MVSVHVFLLFDMLTVGHKPVLSLLDVSTNALTIVVNYLKIKLIGACKFQRKITVDRLDIRLSEFLNYITYLTFY